MKNWAARNPLTGRRNPLFIEADARLLKIAEEARGLTKFDDLVTSRGKRTPKVVRGVVVTGDVFVMSGAAKADLRKRLNADAVEMEGAAVAQVCYQLDVPCLVIRSLSDLADASAEADCERFYKMAAGNSAQFVMHMVELLGRR